MTPPDVSGGNSGSQTSGKDGSGTGQPAANGAKKKEEGRLLTEGEIAEAKTVFGDKLNYSKVRVIDGKWSIFQTADRPMTPNGKIYWPGAQADFTKTGTRAELLTLIHELTHAWQHQQGMAVKLRGFGLHVGSLNGSLFDPYEVEYEPGKPFRSYGLEQQAVLVERMYLGKIPNIVD